MIAPLMCVGIGCLAALLAQPPDQPPPKKEAPPVVAPPAAPPKDDGLRRDYREFFKEPKTPEDYWNALNYEIELGNFELAARLLHGLMTDAKAADADLLALHEKNGMAAFLRLRTIPKWSDDAKKEEQARKDAGALIQQVRDAVKKKLTDPERLKLYVKNLSGTPEESGFALRELYRSGPEVVPYLVERLETAGGLDRANLLDALRRLSPETLPPLYAALDIDDPLLQADLIDVFRKRAATGAAPFLWRLTASGNDAVRQKATEAIAYFLDTPESRLRPAKDALTREAERYFLHQVPFADPKAVTVWRYDPTAKKLVRGWPGAEVVTADQAEEYYGIRNAKDALAIDPAYAPAQVVLLSLAMDKAAARPPAKGGSVQELLETINPDAAVAVLERALGEHHTAVVLAAVKALGDLADVRAARTGAGARPPLVEALFYPDRRVQFAAAEALLKLPGAPTNATSRIVEVLRRSLAVEPGGRTAPRVLTAYFDDVINRKVAESVTKSGFEAVPVKTGNAVLRRLAEAADVDLLLIDETLPDPDLANLLAQLRADLNASPLPIVLTAKLDREDAVRRIADRYRNVTVIPLGLVLDDKELAKVLKGRLTDDAPQLTEAEAKENAERSVRWLARLAKGDPEGYDVRPASRTVFAALRGGRLSEVGQQDAIGLIGRLPGADAQRELANVVMDDKRPAKLRTAAVGELVRHVQLHSDLLAPAQAESLQGLYAKATDQELKESLARLQGALRPDAKVSGERLLKYQPPTPGPAAPPKEPPPPPKDK
jgi:CheY-like chemotaxis protein